MSYRCKLCNSLVGPGQPIRYHTIYREAPVIDALRPLPRRLWGRLRMEIAAEIPACGKCLSAIAAGVDLHELISEGRKLRELAARQKGAKMLLSTVGAVSNGISGYSGRMVNGKFQITPFANSPPPKHRSEDDNGDSNDPPKCDVCGMDATDGQVTADTVLCRFHCKKAAGK